MSAVSSRIPVLLGCAGREPGGIIKLDCPVPYFKKNGLSITIISKAQARTAAVGTHIRHDGDTRTARKRRAILDAATTLFLRDGYPATSMDQIAAAAVVSKQTVYKQFADKQSLFREIVADTVAEVADPVAQQVAGLRDSGDLEADLRDLAHALLAQVIQPRVMQLRRLVIAEAGRFPDLGRLFYERGPGRTIAALATAFKHLAARGALQADDPQTAAEHFNWLVMSTPVNQVMLCGDTELPGRDSLSHYADAGTRAFLAAYGPG